MIDPQQQAKHPVSLMAGPSGHPFHPILVTVPIGAWTAFVILLPVALLGFTMFFRWIGVYRATPAAVPAAASTDVVPAERHLPVPVVLAHGALAATTLVLVLLAAIGV